MSYLWSQARTWSWLLAMAVVSISVARASDDGSTFARVIDRVQPRVVKIYGAGGLGGLESYQTGFLVSADGQILTALSTVLDTDQISVTLADGRKFAADLHGVDAHMALALLKIEAEDLSFFDLSRSVPVDVGARVLAFSNLFRVAQGNEAVSVQHGCIAAVTQLNARRGVYNTPYRGPIYVLDAITNNPGAAGGVLTDRRGRLLGILGKELRSALNHTWLNYAIPVAEIAPAVEDILAGKSSLHDDTERFRPEAPLLLSDLGITLVPDIVKRTPPYVDLVRERSPADIAGLAADDLILFVNDRLVGSCRLLKEEFEFFEEDARVKLTIMRGQELIELELQKTTTGRIDHDE